MEEVCTGIGNGIYNIIKISTMPNIWLIPMAGNDYYKRETRPKVPNNKHPNSCRQPNLWFNDICLEVLITNVLGQRIPRYSYYKCHASDRAKKVEFLTAEVMTQFGLRFVIITSQTTIECPKCNGFRPFNNMKINCCN